MTKMVCKAKKHCSVNANNYSSHVVNLMHNSAYLWSFTFRLVLYMMKTGSQLILHPEKMKVLFLSVCLLLFFVVFKYNTQNSHCQNKIEPVHEISNNVVFATSKASDQPAHTHSLIRAFAIRLSIL